MGTFSSLLYTQRIIFQSSNANPTEKSCILSILKGIILIVRHLSANDLIFQAPTPHNSFHTCQPLILQRIGYSCADGISSFSILITGTDVCLVQTNPFPKWETGASFMKKALHLSSNPALIAITSHIHCLTSQISLHQIAFVNLDPDLSGFHLFVHFNESQ